MAVPRTDAPLQRLPSVQVSLEADGSARIAAGDCAVQAGRYGITVLDLFRRPHSLREALDQFQPSSDFDWIEFAETCRQFIEAGLLREVDAERIDVIPAEGGFGDPEAHVTMLNDRRRTDSYLRAIDEIIRPTDVVVDLGTGTGVMAMAAARAGARRVYAIEASPAMAAVASRNLAANGFSDRITILQGWSPELAPPERADVLISEIIGNDPFNEGVQQYVQDMRRRFLKPAARIVPMRLKVLGLAISIPDEPWSRARVTQQALDNWSDWYGFDFEALAALRSKPGRPMLLRNTYELRSWPALTEPLLLAELDLLANGDHCQDRTVDAVCSCSGILSGFLIYFSLELVPGLIFSTAPSAATPSNSWRALVWGVDPPLVVREGQSLRIRYRVNMSHTGTTVDVSLAD